MNEVTLTYTRYDWDGNYEGTVTMDFQTEGDLKDMLFHYKNFLQGVSFNYVKELHAILDNDEVVGEE